MPCVGRCQEGEQLVAVDGVVEDGRLLSRGGPVFDHALWGMVGLGGLLGGVGGVSVLFWEGMVVWEGGGVWWCYGC